MNLTVTDAGGPTGTSLAFAPKDVGAHDGFICRLPTAFSLTQVPPRQTVGQPPEIAGAPLFLLAGGCLASSGGPVGCCMPLRVALSGADLDQGQAPYISILSELRWHNDAFVRHACATAHYDPSTESEHETWDGTSW